MSASPFDLPSLQSWMQAVLMDFPQDSSGARQVDDVITASSQQTSRQRLDVYRHAYQLRLLECLREEFSTLSQFLGEDVFSSLAAAYLEARPSQSYTLANLGARFPQFLADAADHRQDGASTEFVGKQFLVDLATLERLYAEVFDGPGMEGLPSITVETLQQIDPSQWPEVRFEAAPCLRLVEFGYPVHEFVTACRRGTEPPIPAPNHTWLAVTRRQFVVRRVPLTRPQYRLLTLLMQGLPLGDALEQVAETCDDVEAFLKDLQQWFRDWTAAGFFQAIKVG